VLLFLALTAERADDPLLYNGGGRSFMAVFAPLFESLPGVRQPAWNLLLLGLTALSLLRPAAWRARAWPMDAAISLSLGTIAFGVAWGVAHGGSAYWAYYQLHPFLTGLVFALGLSAALRGAGDLRIVGTTIVAAALLRALLALVYFFSYVRGTEFYPPHMTNHHDSPLFAAGAIVLLVWSVARRSWRTWALSIPSLIALLMAMKVNNRRIVWFELMVALAFFYLVLPGGRLRRIVNRWALVLVPVLALYVAVGWGRPGALFTPLRAFDSTTGENQDASSLARNEENLNLIITYIQHPLLGSGWGQQFISVSSYYAYFGGGFDEMYRYTPHNSVAALIAFTGVVGLFGTLGVLPTAAFLGARACRQARRPTTRVAATVAVCQLPVFGIHAYGDIGLQSVTSCLLLGAALASADRVAAWTGGWPVRGARRRVRRTPRPAAQAAA
jgi:hypothetical protein